MESNTASSKSIADLYQQHIETVIERHQRAMEQHDFDALAVFSGSLHMQFMDDMSYPFKANPHFKNWAPLIHLPDSLLF